MKKLMLLLAVLVLTSAGKVSASENVAFPTCIAPTGTVIADYPNGSHGIVGQGSKIGKDTVYSLPSNNALQCLCAENGEGIQTNWRYAANLTDDEIKILENEGWIYVPDGSAWGLSQGAYLAKNINYSCSSSTTTSGGGDGRTDGLTDGRSDGLGSIVQSSAGNLASTGNLLFIAQIFGLGVFLTLTGLALRFRSK